jgi:hypothetical protein
MIVLAGKTTPLGEVITAGVIAGGSKASIKLFRDVLGFQSSAYQERKALAKVPSAAALPTTTRG